MSEPSIPQLRDLLQKECDLLINVAVGETTIQDVEMDYRKQHTETKQLSKEVGFEYNNPHFSLWGFWSYIKDWGTYSDRRKEVFRIYAEMFEALDDLEENAVKVGSDLQDLSGWPTVDSQTAELKKVVNNASTTLDWQDVGYRSRSILLTLCNTLFIPERHQPADEDPIKGDDFKRKMEEVIKVELGGKDHERLRPLVRATWNFVNEVGHAKSSEERTGRLAAIATVNFVEMSRLMIPTIDEETGEDELLELRAEIAKVHQAEEDAYHAEGMDDPRDYY